MSLQRIAETIAFIKEEGADELKYNITGIGGDETCYLQVVADSACKNAEEIKILADENVFNAVKVRLVFVHCNKTCMCYIWVVCVVLLIFWPS